MKLLSVFLKSLREQRRDAGSLLMILLSAPFFVVIYWLFFGGGSTSYGVLVINQDAGITRPDGTHWNAGEGVIGALAETITYEDGQPMLKVKRVTDRASAEDRLKNREASALLIIPADFSRALLAADSSGTLTLVGDLTNTYYAVASVLANAALTGYVDALTGTPPALTVHEEALGDSAARTEFEIYVPGLLIFAVLMLVYQTAMVVTREVEAGTLARLRLTGISALDLLGGISASQVVIGVAAVILTFLTALALDFHSAGPVWAAILITAVTALSSVGVGLIVSCFVKTTIQATLASTFALFVMMFLTGTFMPISGFELFTLGGHTFRVFDVLPPTHAVVALNKVMTLGEGLGAVGFELGAVLALSGVYFGAGIWLFQRTHLRRG